MNLKNLFGSNASTRNTSFPNKSTLHGCPFCRCKSLSPSLEQIDQRPDSSYKLYLGKQFLNQKCKNKSLGGNIYYRTFQSPKRRGLSPNMNKKIVIKYTNNPFYQTLNEESIVSKNKILAQLDNDSLKKSVFYQEKQKNIKNIYLNQNTPPKSKFLSKRSSSRQKNEEVFKKKNSNKEQKYQNNPKLIAAQSIQIKVQPKQKNNNQLSKIRVLQRQDPQQPGSNKNIRYYRFGDNNRLEVSPIKPNTLNNLNYIESKNTIQRLSSPRASSSPYGSNQQNSTQIFPFIFQKSLEKAKQQTKRSQDQNIQKSQKKLSSRNIEELARDEVTQNNKFNDKERTIQKNKSRQNIDYNYSESDNNGTSQKKINFHVYNKDSLKNIQTNSFKVLNQNKDSEIIKKKQQQQKMHKKADSELQLSQYQLASQLSQDLNLNYDYYEGQPNSDLSISENIAF